ncbi:hypothetical protein GGI25_000008 [Coemansia spiralis]|uniref:Uncharacterized protein n=1 Tax=Coemansia spiralis TaxID=417178 RepID=A0A9W8L0S1_9FUNG|nr:hypothetical protein GGI25_000008 [Coemansia spiralis]
MPQLNLEQKLAKWAEQPEDDDEDSDYGLIIDDSVTTEPPKFSKAGSCSQLPSTRSPPSLLPANLHTLGPWATNIKRPPAKSFASAQDLLQRYVETTDEENYDDLVLPEEAELLDKQLAEWRTPKGHGPEWSSGQVPMDVTMSGATAVEHDTGRSLVPSAVCSRHAGGDSSYTTPTLNAAAALAPARPRALTTMSPAGREQTLGLGLGLVNAGTRPTPRQQKIAFSRQRLAQTQRPTRRPMLIRNTQRAAEAMVVGCMRYDPVSRMWLGNEEEGSRIAHAIAESERQLRAHGVIRSERPLDADKLARKISQRAGNPNLVPALPELVAGSPEHDAAIASDHSQKVFWSRHGTTALRPTSPRAPVSVETGATRPALISPAAIAGVGGACGQGRPVFDPQHLRWVDPAHESQGNALWNIAELPLEPIDAIHKGRLRSASEAIGVDSSRNCFVLTDEQIDAYHRESIDYAAFARHWFPKPST